MKRSAKCLLSLLLVLAMALSLTPGFVLAEEEETLLAAGTSTFESYEGALEGQGLLFTPEADGNVTVAFSSCTPGYSAEIYEDAALTELYAGSEAGTHTFAVTAGKEYRIMLYCYDMVADDFSAGSVTYRYTFLANGADPGETPDEPEDPSLIPGATPENPKEATGSYWEYIGGGQTVWYLFDNYQNMVDNSVYSMMLHIISSADYTVTYAGEEVPVDENGFVNFEMKDTAKQGKYLFSITNHLAEEKFFSVEIKERPIYFNSGESLVIGRNNLTLDTTYPYTLYSFSPSETGIYQIQIRQGQVGDFGTPFNPTDNTPNKTNTLFWTCTSVGQSAMIGFRGPAKTTCSVIRTGDYIPSVEVPWTFYENTFDFIYELNGEIPAVDVDLMDGGQHTAALGEDGFYHYGSATGPLMVTDLKTIEINIADAHLNGGLRAWLLDEQGDTVSKIDYNEAMFEYLNAGLVPVTEELAVMLQDVGTANGWWVSGGLVFPETAPADVSNAWMQLCGYLPEPQGVTLSGSITTGAEGDTTVELLSGEEVITTVTASGTYSIDSVAAGTYTLKVSKQNHVTREYTVTVADETVTQDVKLHLIGDIDGLSGVNMGDISIMYAHIKGTVTLTDPYQILAANVNGDQLNMGDFSALYAHIKGTIKLY